LEDVDGRDKPGGDDVDRRGPTDIYKKKTPAQGAGVFDRGAKKRPARSAVGGFPGDARNIRAADADIGKLPIVEPAQLMQAGIVAPPGLEEPDNGLKQRRLKDVDNGVEHDWSPFPGRLEGNGPLKRSETYIGCLAAAQQTDCCARSYALYA
jgi:hypothetical protein